MTCERVRSFRISLCVFNCCVFYLNERDLRRIVRDYRKSENKKKIKKNIKKAKGELEKYFLKKVSISDPECRMMQNKKGFSELSYNTQISVSRNQIIVANDVCQDGHDAHQLIPQMRNIKENIKLRKNTKVGVDCAYSDAENIKFAENECIDLYVPSRAQAQEFDDKFKKKKDVPFFFKERLRMRDKMSTQEGRKVYGLRKITVEPVYGNIKANLGFKEFLLRGIEKVKIELNLVCIAHNLQKIWRLRMAQSC